MSKKVAVLILKIAPDPYLHIAFTRLVYNQLTSIYRKKNVLYVESYLPYEDGISQKNLKSVCHAVYTKISEERYTPDLNTDCASVVPSTDRLLTESAELAILEKFFSYRISKDALLKNVVSSVEDCIKQQDFEILFCDHQSYIALPHHE